MKPIPIIRPMRSSDLDQIMEIEATVFSDTWPRKSYEHEIHGNTFSLPIVLILNKALVGYAVAWNYFHEFHIATIAVAREYQGQGWGEYLLKYLLGIADLVDYALLEVRRSNIPAISLYQKYGFKVIAERKRYYRNGEDALVMRKEWRRPGEESA